MKFADQPSRTGSSQKISRLGLYIPFGIAAVVVVAWFAYWNIAKGVMETELVKWIDGQKADGMIVTHQGFEVGGFPFFLRAEINQPYFEKPGDHSWSAATLMVDTLPYNPTSLTFTPMGKQTVILQSEDGAEEWNFAGETIRIRMAEDALALTIVNLLGSGPEAGRVTIKDLAMNYEMRSGPEGGAKDVAALVITGSGIMAGQGTKQLDLTLVNIAGGMTHYSAYEQTGSYATWGYNGGEILIDTVQLDLGGNRPAAITLAGQMSVDEQAYPTGRLNVTLKNPEQIIDLLNEDWEVLPRRDAKQVRDIVSAMAAANNGIITAPIAMDKGKLKFAGFKVADLPKVE